MGMLIAKGTFIICTLCVLAVSGCENSPASRHPTRSRQPASDARYVGYEYEGVVPNDTLSNGVVESGGALIGDVADTSYALSFVSRGHNDMLWLEHVTGGTNRHIRWRVDAVFNLPVLPRGQVLAWGASCAVDGTNDPEVVAAVVHADTERYTQIVRAWRADRQHHTFRSIDTRGITCENEGYGTDDSE